MKITRKILRLVLNCGNQYTGFHRLLEYISSMQKNAIEDEMIKLKKFLSYMSKRSVKRIRRKYSHNRHKCQKAKSNNLGFSNT